MDKPLVSIALCTYNGEKYLVEQLDSIVNQTYSNLEVIVVDDCSSDRTLNILQSYSKKVSYVKIHKNAVNLGYIKNFEKAINMCTGEFIALADQDDIWDLNKIAMQVNEIGDHTLIYHDSEFIDEHGTSLKRRISDVRRFYSGDDSRYFLFENCVSGHTILFNKRLIPFLDDFKSEIFHDWWLAYVATNIGSISFINQPLVNYRQHNNATTDILRAKRGVSEKRNIRSEKFNSRIKLFANYKYNTKQEFKSKLLHLLEKKEKQNFSLFIFLLKYRNILLFIQKKGLWSKINYCRKFI